MEFTMNAQKGFLLMVVVLWIIILGFIGVAVTYMFTTSAYTATNANAGDKAFYIAASGLEVASHDLKNNNVTCNAINDNSNYTNVSLFGGQFTVTSTANVASSTLANAMNASQTSFTVANASGFVSSGTLLLIMK